MNQAKDLLTYAHADYLCDCGQRHRTDIDQIIIGQDLAPSLLRVFKERASSRVPDVSPGYLLVCDENTGKAAGNALHDRLHEAGLPGEVVSFPAKPSLVPDEQAVFRVVQKLEPATGLLIAVGSGTLNDLTRFVSSRTGIPYVIVATAPSMDGYASSVSALVIDHMKQTVPGCGAVAIMANPEVLAACPQVMLAAGLGDILGKYSAICDWNLGHLVDEEYMCPSVAQMTLDTVHRCHEAESAIKWREPSAVTRVFEGLIMTGIAMSYVGNSRPASGSEHHLSHFWEMAFQLRGIPPVLHGSKVGLATIITCALYQHLLVLKPDFDAARKAASDFDYTMWKARVKTIFGAGAQPIIDLEQEVKKHDPAVINRHLDRLEANWPAFCETIKQIIPPHESIRDTLRNVGGAITPGELGIDRSLVKEALRYALDMRERYTVLRLYNELGLTEKAIDIAMDVV
jgi:glycerol-1-phosphate dehydrogenase [NAD(P)+]